MSILKSINKSFAFALVLVLSLNNLYLPVSASAKASQGKTDGGKAANFITLENVKPRIITAGNTVTQDVNASYFIEQAEGASAIVVGTYFNSYYDAKKALSFPDNAPVTFGLLYDNGEIYHTGYDSNLAYTKDGRWLIGHGRAEVKAHITRGGYEFSITIGIVNTIDEWGGARLLTDKLGMTAPVRDGATAFLVENGVVKERITSDYMPKSGQKLIYFNAEEYKNHIDWKMDPQVGDKVEVSISFPGFGNDAYNIATAVSSGPLILRNGVDVSSDTQYNSAFTDAKNKGVAQRTFVGVTKNNTLIVGAAGTSFEDAAKTLLGMGCTDAIALDGGASCFLWANGSTIQAAGRKLNNVIAFYDANAPETKPAENREQSGGKELTRDRDYLTRDGENLGVPLRLLEANPGDAAHTSYVMMRAIADVLNLSWAWDANAGIATFTGSHKNGQAVTMSVRNGDKNMTVNGISKPIMAGAGNVPAKIIEGRFFVPARAFEDAFGAEVVWNSATSSIMVK